MESAFDFCPSCGNRLPD
ncbi:MAG: hypothetical protein ACOX3X_01075 [Eubacteriales bacterium]